MSKRHFANRSLHTSLSPSLPLPQLLSDLIPLRIVPPLLLAGLTTLLVGFRGGMYYFNYTLALVLLSCVAAVINGVIGMLGKCYPSSLPFCLLIATPPLLSLAHHSSLLPSCPPSLPRQPKAS